MDSTYITNIKVNHVRHLKDIEIPLSESERKHLIITGKNGSGKTSLLEAMRLAIWLYSEVPPMRSRIIEKLNKENDPLKSQFQINKILPNAGDIIYYQEKNFLNFFKEKVGVEIEMKSFNFKEFQLNLKNFIIAYYPAEREYSVSNERGLEKVNLKEISQIYEYPSKYFVKYLKELKAQEALYQVNGNIERANEIKSWLENLTRTLRNVFSNEKLTLELNPETFEFKINEPGKIPFAFDELASGYSASLAVILDLMMRMEKKVGRKYDIPGIVLIDEVDAHLHLSLQKNILPTLTTLFPNIQFIVTTHSPFVLNSISNAVVYNLETKTLVNTEEGLSRLPYSGIVEGYFGVSELSAKLKEKFERYKELSKKAHFTDDDYNELGDLESYLDEIPDFLALDIMADYRQIKLELEQREEAEGNNGQM